MSASPVSTTPPASTAPPETSASTAADQSPSSARAAPMTAAEFQSIPHAPYMGARKTKRCADCGIALPSSTKPQPRFDGSRGPTVCTSCALKGDFAS